MDENQISTTDETEKVVCKNCGNVNIEEGYTLPLCKECRDKYAKRPVPLWIKAVAGIILLVLLYAITRFPSTIITGIEFEKGLKAERAHKYYTALNEYKKVIARYPDSTLTLARLYVSYYQNEKISEAYKTLDIMAKKDAPSNETVQEVNNITAKIEKFYIPTKDLNELIGSEYNEKPEKIVEVLEPYVEKKTEDAFAASYLANAYFNLKKYDKAETIMNKVISSNRDYYPGYLFLAAVYRETGNYEKGIAFCNAVLKNNNEDTQAYITLSRIELKRHQDKKGLEFAQKAYKLDKDDSHIVATLSLAYHYNNMMKERDQMFALLKKFQDNNTYDIDLLTSIFNGENKWRE